MSIRRTVSICLWVLSAVILVAGFLLVWLFKDGMGPDAVDSQGVTALRRFSEGAVWILLLSACPCGLACLVYPWHNVKQGKDAVKETQPTDKGVWPPPPSSRPF